MMKWYLDGKIMKPGWEYRRTMIQRDVEMPDKSLYFYPAIPDKEYIRKFDEIIPIKQIHRGWNSIHFVMKQLRN